MFTFPENKRQGFFLLPDELVGKIGENGPYATTWARLTPSTRAVLFTLGNHVDENGEAFPGEERIAGLSDLTRKTVRRCLLELEESQIIQVKQYLTRNGKRGKKFIWKLRRSSSDSMRFYHSMIDCGIWRKITPSAKSLYLSFRFFGRARPDLDPDFDESASNYGDWLEGDDWSEYLQERKVDYCNAEPQILCDFAGISRRQYLDAVESLKAIKLLSDYDDEYLEVAIHPTTTWKTDFLNREIIKNGGIK